MNDPDYPSGNASGRKPVLVDLGSNTLISIEEDAASRFYDYYEIYLGPTVDAHIRSVFYGERLLTPREMLDDGYITKGQWLIWVVDTFYGEMTNGGIAQFLVNCPRFLSDVAVALKILELSEFYKNYVCLVEPLIDELDKNRRLAARTPESGQTGLMEDYYAVLERLENSAEGSKINDNFVMEWDENLMASFWPPEKWSQRMLNQAIAYMQKHPGEFLQLKN